MLRLADYELVSLTSPPVFQSVVAEFGGLIRESCTDSALIGQLLGKRQPWCLSPRRCQTKRKEVRVAQGRKCSIFTSSRRVPTSPKGTKTLCDFT